MARDHRGVPALAREPPDQHADRALGLADHRCEHSDRILGLAFEHQLRTLTAKPELASIFLVVNGFLLFGAEFARRRAAVRELAIREGAKPDGGRELDTLEPARRSSSGSPNRRRWWQGSAATRVHGHGPGARPSTTPMPHGSRSCSRRRSSSPPACSNCPISPVRTAPASAGRRWSRA